MRDRDVWKVMITYAKEQGTGLIDLSFTCLISYRIYFKEFSESLYIHYISLKLDNIKIALTFTSKIFLGGIVNNL